MSSLLHPTLTTREIIRMASRELDAQQLRFIASLSPTQRLELMFQLCEFVQQLAYQVERQENPDASEEEIAARLRRRMELSYA